MPSNVAETTRRQSMTLNGNRQAPESSDAPKARDGRSSGWGQGGGRLGFQDPGRSPRTRVRVCACVPTRECVLVRAGG